MNLKEKISIASFSVVGTVLALAIGCYRERIKHLEKMIRRGRTNGKQR